MEHYEICTYGTALAHAAQLHSPKAAVPALYTVGIRVGSRGGINAEEFFY
jgi:hypothetical protein